MTCFERMLNIFGNQITKEEFFKAYHLYLQGNIEEANSVLNSRLKDVAYVHLFTAYLLTYPEKRKDWGIDKSKT